MEKGKKKKGSGDAFWATADGLLVTILFCLLAYASFFPQKEPSFAFAGGEERITQPPTEGKEHGPSAKGRDDASPARRRLSRAVDGIRVSTQMPVGRIARDMAAADWNAAPASPAMDMREDDKAFEIFFSLPDNIQPSSVNVDASGNMLTLSMRRTNGRKLVQSFLIPCDVNSGDGRPETHITNRILRVRLARGERTP